MTFQVYVIKNSKGRLYIGLSENVATRVDQHNNGTSRWTKGKGPWSLAWTSAQMPLSEARKLENLLKRQKGGSGFFAITGLPKPSS
jgi:putative endonuclease